MHIYTHDHSLQILSYVYMSVYEVEQCGELKAQQNRKSLYLYIKYDTESTNSNITFISNDKKTVVI